MKGPLAPYATGFYAELINQGYAHGSARNQMVLMSRVSHWMIETGLRTSELTLEAVDPFVALRRAQGRERGISPRGMAPLLGYLRRIGAAPEPSSEAPATTELETLLAEYRTYLAKERGVAARTVEHYLTPARLFLSKRSEMDGLGLKDLTAVEVTGFVVHATRGRRTGLAQWIVTGMRALLRFLHVSGKISSPLAQVVPGVASWRLSTLPRALEPYQVDRLLASCDQTTPAGVRDLAILTALIRLGLRAGEVAALELRDIDWRHGEIVIHGKGNRVERLPLPADVGQAIVTWLQVGRLVGSDAHVFTRIPAPHRGLAAAGVSMVVRSAAIRAGLPRVSAHRLRHTAATQMLRSGASLAEIGQVLRHHSPEATAIYAKVDRTSLSGLARPWPGDVI